MLQPGPALYRRFSPAEAGEIWARFEHVDAALQQPNRLGWEPGFQGGPTPYHFHDVPTPARLTPLFGARGDGAGL